MPLASGRRLGPYEVLGLLGAGGMGEVYRARDARLGREVAVKVLPEEVARDPERLSRFEREARAVAALNHPNILTVFDVGTHESVPYVVTELLEGETLRELVSHRSPTQRQALFFAAQVAHGLEAAHAKGIVHRDVKPENVFVTTDGRVKLLDFGLAKVADRLTGDSGEATESSPTGAGQLVGTVGYMSPEQVRGLPVDHRTDIFSFGVMVYELLSGKHPFRRETTVGTLTAILEETPAELSTVGRGVPPALSGIVQRCLSKGREERFRSAHDLALSLEAVLQAPAGAASLQEVEERSPYPGLMSFTEKEAGSFFGREAEVSALWGKLRARRLLAVIAPSGAGKTSLVRAGVVPSRPEGWAAIVSTPGAAPLRGLGRALVPELSGDPEALVKLVDIDDPAVAFDVVSRWRKGQGEALLVVDQFEELFTLNAREVQERFAGLLGRLVREADVHVVLSLRDDFLIRCSEHQPLAPVFESLTPLPGLTVVGLRRALVEPAKKRGYAFEDEGLVEEMVESVEGARGALPLLAFAVSRLWEKRDRERRLLTRAAYEEIGGVAGALAQHAEATLDRIGTERHGMVREIFRNLVTAQGTRAVGEREELLSLFPERTAAEAVLAELVDARLLTSYEVKHPEEEGGSLGMTRSVHRVEIVHESLLKAWPRLVRWQTQDEEGSQLRDQLKQAAHLWEEKGRPADVLWSGTSFREYELWRERYAGALTALEEDFAKAMAERAQRQQRLRRLVAGSILAAALVVAGVTGALWRRSEAARQRGAAETLRAEAGKLLALARAEIDRYPTAALAYVRGSLELADTADARRFAVEVLWRGPVARLLPFPSIAGSLLVDEYEPIDLSPDGRWLAAQSPSGRLLLFPRDGGAPRSLSTPIEGNATALRFGPRSDRLVARSPGSSLRLLSVPDLQEIRRVELGGVWSMGWIQADRLVALTVMPPPGPGLLRTWPLGGGEPRTVARLDPLAPLPLTLDAAGRWLVRGRGRTLFRRSLEGSGSSAEQVVGELPDDVADVQALNRGDLFASIDKAGEIRLWSPSDGAPVRVLGTTSSLFKGFSAIDRGGWRLAAGDADASVRVWDLRDPADADPLVLQRPEKSDCLRAAFDGSGTWLATSNCLSVAFWPVGSPRRRTLRGHGGLSYAVAFSPDSQWLATCTPTQPVRLWPIDPSKGSLRPLLPAQPCFGLAWDPTGARLLEGTTRGGAFLYPLGGGSPRPLRTGWEQRVGTCAMAFDAHGRRAAASPMGFEPSIRDPKLRALRVWDLETGEGRSVSMASLTDESWVGLWGLRFAPDGRLLAAGQGGVRRLALPTEPDGTLSSETLLAAGHANLDLSADGRTLLVWANPTMGARYEELRVLDLATGSSRRITTHGRDLFHGAIDPSGRIIATGDTHGVVRVGPATGEEPHLLLGHEGTVYAVAISPDGRWIASASDKALHLWPMPDLTRPPLHTLPHAELTAKLDALTNLRVVRDPSSSTGWKLDLGPFPGWKDVPTW